MTVERPLSRRESTLKIRLSKDVHFGLLGQGGQPASFVGILCFREPTRTDTCEPILEKKKKWPKTITQLTSRRLKR